VTGGRTRLRACVSALSAGILAAGLTAALATAGSAPGLLQRANDARLKEHKLAAQSRSALLGLYALDTKLAGARARLVDLQARLVGLERDLGDAQVALSVARRTLAVSQAQLGIRLRAIYEQGETDPIAVLLGAASLDEMLTGLDSVTRTARQDKQVILQTSTARDSLVVLSRSLDKRRADLQRLTAVATAATEALGRVRAERAGYLARLTNERRLSALDAVSLEARARAAQATSQTLATQQSLATFVPPAVSPAASVATVGGRAVTVVATGYSLGGATATGIPTGWGVVAVDPAVIPLGTRITIPGYGEGVAADTGVHGAIIDLWFPTNDQAFAWGRRVVTVVLH
jgi:3D (Asp-Asp-Asp) domain-containing protein/septal ring factor EnvC (AmiA/AmiB activator)